MKHLLKHLNLLVIITLCSVSLVFAGRTTITILHVNDTHSHLDAFGPKDWQLHGTIGGIAKAATIIGTERMKNPGALLLHAGDAFVGDFAFNTTFGAAELQMMSQLGFDAMAVGNHEFDLGPDPLLGSLTAAQPTFPLLSANLDLSQVPGLKNYIKSDMLLTRSGVKIGIFGMTVPDNPTTNSAPVVVLSADQSFAAAGAEVASLRAQGAELVICLSHLGTLYDQALASTVPGIDVIVGGHDHYLYTEPLKVTQPTGGQTLILQAGSFYLHVGKLELTLENGVIAKIRYRMLDVDEHVRANPAVQAAVDNVKALVTQTYGNVYGKVLGMALRDIEKEYKASSPNRDTPLGDVITDAMRKKGQTQIGLTALGLMSEKIYAGPIVGADVFHAVPYGFDPATGLGFKLATISIRGDELLKGLEITLSMIGINEDFFPQVSGMSFSYDPTKPANGRVDYASVRIGGQPIDPMAMYSATVNEGLLGLLPIMQVKFNLTTMLPDYEYNVLKDYIHAQFVMTGRVDSRIKDASIRTPHRDSDIMIAQEESAASETVPVETTLSQNYPNPFNPTTRISYTIGRVVAPSANEGRTSTGSDAGAGSHVRITIYDVLGREVAMPVDEVQTPGHHEVNFDAHRLSSGMYFYRLDAGNVHQTKTMRLVK
jgi:5'-nucleotidase